MVSTGFHSDTDTDLVIIEIDGPHHLEAYYYSRHGFFLWVLQLIKRRNLWHPLHNSLFNVAVYVSDCFRVLCTVVCAS